MESPLVVTNVSKCYNNQNAISNISFNVKHGEIFGLIGPDGSGKTTLMRIITTLLLPDNGSIKVNGLDVVRDFKKVRSTVGYMPGRFSLYSDLTVEENLNFFATVFKTTIKENYHLIKDIYSQIEPFKNRAAGKLSGGMKQKLALSCALIHNPSVLVLDEPTTGVDAVSRKEFWEMLKSLKNSGITILVSTPYMDETELCDRVALMQQGNILQIDQPSQIIASFKRPLYQIRNENNYLLLKILRTYQEIEQVYLFGQHLHFTVKKEEVFNEHDLIEYLTNKIGGGVEFNKIAPNIEDVFIKLMTDKVSHKQKNRK